MACIGIGDHSIQVRGGGGAASSFLQASARNVKQARDKRDWASAKLRAC